jgi:hypothetical protein
MNLKRPKSNYPTAQQLLERDVTKQVKDFMEFRGWRPVRMQRTVVPGAFQTGEPGIPDFLFVRYLRTAFSGLSVAVWIELKRARGGKVSDEQHKWRDREKARGAIVLKASNIADFEREYERLFGWMRTEEWVDGQKQISYDEATNSDLQAVTAPEESR